MHFQVVEQTVALYSTQNYIGVVDQQILPELFWNTKAKIGGLCKTAKQQE